MNLLKWAFLTAIIGILALLWLSSHLEPNLGSISEISTKNLGSWIKVQGQIESIKQTETLAIIKIADENNNTINIIAQMQNSAFQKDSKIEVIGKITEYNGMLEIEASKIKTVENAS
jgi:RecJ-like exonuclease